MMAMGLAREFEKREEAIRAGRRKLDEKRRLRAEKKVKRKRDDTEKENGERYQNIFTCFETSNVPRVEKKVIVIHRGKYSNSGAPAAQPPAEHPG